MRTTALVVILLGALAVLLPAARHPNPHKVCYLLAGVGGGYLTTNNGERLTC